MKKRKVCISGIGMITPLGTGWKKFWQNLLTGKTGIRPTNIFKFPVDPDETALHMAAPVDFDPVPGLDNTLPEDLYWGDRLLCHATSMAIDDAKINSLPSNTAVIIGAGASSALNIEEFESQLTLDISKNRNITRVPIGMASSEKIIANRFRLFGPKMMIATACSSSSLALGYSFDLVSTGECDCAIAGCAETLCQLTHSGFYGLRSIDPDRCRPFDRDRRGISIGEAAIVLILEPLEKVVQRKKEVYCTVEGYAANCDAGRMTSPDETGKVFLQLMQKALKNASVSPEDVGYVCAHGTGTVINDITEAKAIKQLFTLNSTSPWVSSIKGATGHCMAAAGIFNCATVALALKNEILPPNTGLKNKDERCDISILKKSIRLNCKVAIANAFAFGGNNVSIVFKKWEKEGSL